MFLGSLFLFLMSFNFPPSLEPGLPGPDFWPRVILVCLMGLSLLLFIVSLKGKGTKEIDWNIKHLMPVFLLGLLYLLLINYLNYLIATFFFIILLLVFLGVRNWKTSVLFNIIYLIIVYFIFVRILGVPLI